MSNKKTHFPMSQSFAKRALVSITSTLLGLITPALAESPPLPPVELFISPYCGLSVGRFKTLLPYLDELRHAPAPLRIHLIAMSWDASEQRELKYMVCANEQGVLVPLFFYLANAARYKRKPDIDYVINYIGVDKAKLLECVSDPQYAERIIKESSNTFFSSGLTGLPSVKQGSDTFTFTDADYLVRMSRGLITPLQHQEPSR